MSKWISVNDDLPPYGKPVLLSINYVVQHVTFVRDSSDDGSYDWFEPYNFNEPEHGISLGCVDKALHWMPLPESPINEA